jgi:hypothetical protein
MSNGFYTSSVAVAYRELANLLLIQGRTREAQSILELLKVQELQGYGEDQEKKSDPHRHLLDTNEI